MLDAPRRAGGPRPGDAHHAPARQRRHPAGDGAGPRRTRPTWSSSRPASAPGRGSRRPRAPASTGGCAMPAAPRPCSPGGPRPAARPSAPASTSTGRRATRPAPRCCATWPTLDVAGRRVVVQRDGGDPLLADAHPRPRRRRRRRPRLPLAPARGHRPGAAVDRRRLRRAPRRRHVHLRLRGGQHVRPGSRPRRAARRPRRSRARHRRRPRVRGRPAAPRRRAGRRTAPSPARRHGEGAGRGPRGASPRAARRGRGRPLAGHGPGRRGGRHGRRAHAGEARVLDVLVARSPAVVPKSALVDDGVDTHAAEASVARLRAKLGPLGAAIRTVPRRGYVCSLGVEPADGRCRRPSRASPDPRRRQRPTRVGKASTCTAHCL